MWRKPLNLRVFCLFIVAATTVFPYSSFIRASEAKMGGDNGQHGMSAECDCRDCKVLL